MIKSKGIYKSYGKIQILKNIDLEIIPGSITVLIGPSGSGKTTLLNALSLLSPPDKGTIQISEKEFTFPKDKFKKFTHFQFIEGKQKLGVVFQDLLLQPHWTNYENIINPLGNTLNEKLFEKLNYLIKLFKMEKFIHNFPSDSSKGEEQRVAFVRALMLNPQFLLLDEITSALDPEIAATVLKYLIDLRNEGKGILLITHFLVFAQNVADKIIFLDGGEIVEEGTKSIFNSPSTKRLQDFFLSLGGVILNKPNAKVSDISYSLTNNKTITPEEIISDLVQKYTNATTIKEKIRISYRLLDFEQIPDEIHKSIFTLIETNWEIFKKDLFFWLSVKEEGNEELWNFLVNYIHERLENKKYPESKAWIYLLSFKAHPEYRNRLKNVEQTLLKYKNSAHFLVNDIVHRLLKEI